MRTLSTIKALSLAAVLMTASYAAVADQPATPPADANMMGHSPASKEHVKMNETPSTSQAPGASSAPDNGMGHSPASKEHTMMNQAAETSGKAPAAAKSPDNGMGHSPAGKEHSMMKHKHSKPQKSTEAKPAQQ